MFILQGYKQQKAFIIAQGPLESTCTDFWKVVYDRKCGAIVMLSQLTEGGEVASCDNKLGILRACPVLVMKYIVTTEWSKLLREER